MLHPPSRAMSFASALKVLRPTLPCYVALADEAGSDAVG
jgi:hypothetical protein